MLSVWHLAGGAAGNRADSCCFGGFLPNNECNGSQTACAPRGAAAWLRAKKKSANHIAAIDTPIETALQDGLEPTTP